MAATAEAAVTAAGAVTAAAIDPAPTTAAHPPGTSPLDRGAADVLGISACGSMTMGDDLRAKVEAVLDEHVRPGLRADGGDVELVGIDADRIVQVRMIGTCAGCPSATIAMTMGIEAAIKALVPEVRFLEAVP